MVGQVETELHLALGIAWLCQARLLYSFAGVTIPSFKDIRKRLSKTGHVNGNDHQVSLPEHFNPPAVPPRLTYNGKNYSRTELEYLVSEVKDYQITHGSLLKIVEYETDSFVPARPVGTTLLPTPFPRAGYDEAVELQQAYCELYMRIASDDEWLFSVLKPLRYHDKLLTVLWEVFEKVREAGMVQKVVCQVFRNDYMVHQPVAESEAELKQVEMNTFCCAGAAHAERIANMHKHLARVRDCDTSTASSSGTDLPPNSNVRSIVSMLSTAHAGYVNTSTTSHQKCIIIVVQPFNFNVADERPIEIALWDNSIPSYRVEWRTLWYRTSLTQDRTLLFTPPFGKSQLEVSVIYYKGGYIIEEYQPAGRNLRIRLEISRAIKCPDILTHLSGFKTVQAALVEPGAVERFLPPEKAEKIRRTFMPMQILDTSPGGLAARAEATDPVKCARYVLKPNRDGGGHNVYRDDIPAFLRRKPETEWCQYILMRLIEPPPTEGMLMAPESLYHGPVISELGIIGICIWERKGSGEVDVRMNEVGGWTFKTKPVGVDEMSVVKGFGCFDCPLLVT